MASLPAPRARARAAASTACPPPTCAPSPHPSASREGGWAGVALSRDALAVARACARDIALYDPGTGQQRRVMAAASQPYALALLPAGAHAAGGGGDAVAVAEGHMVRCCQLAGMC